MVSKINFAKTEGQIGDSVGDGDADCDIQLPRR